MDFTRPFQRAAFVAVFFAAVTTRAQAPNQDHSCTIEAAGEFVLPFGSYGKNFDSGAGFHVGGGFAVWHSTQSAKSPTLFLTVNYMYDQLKVTSGALSAAVAASNNQLKGATSAHGGFSATTLDLTYRHPISRRNSAYLLGGFGWLRRDVNFDGASPGNLIQPNALSLGRLASNSGAFDLGTGVNFGLRSEGSWMLFAEIRVFKGVAVNSGTILVPVSLGVRW